MSEETTTFHQFSKLPAELRLQIWRLCLPYRVWEMDYPTDEGFFLKPDPNDTYPCNVKCTALLNGLPPVITRVCTESRAVARENSAGYTTEEYYEELDAGDTFISTTSSGCYEDFWLDPKRTGVVNLNWDDGYQAIYQNSAGPAIANLAWESKQVAARPSFDEYWISCSWLDFEEQRFEVFNQIPAWWVIVHSVIIHATFRDAARSGLFGLLGDATVQIVSLSDRERINSFYEFAEGEDREAFSMDRETEQPDWDALSVTLEKDVKWRFRRHDKPSTTFEPAVMFRLCSRVYGCTSSSRKYKEYPCLVEKK